MGQTAKFETGIRNPRSGTVTQGDRAEYSWNKDRMNRIPGRITPSPKPVAILVRKTELGPLPRIRASGAQYVCVPTSTETGEPPPMANDMPVAMSGRSYVGETRHRSVLATRCRPVRPTQAMPSSRTFQDHRRPQLQIGSSSGGCFGSDRLHALMIGWRVRLGQNFGVPIALIHAAFQ